MAARANWKGNIKFSLVSFEVALYPANNSAEKISFNQLHEECHSRINQKKWCSSCNREIANTEIVSGYEYEKGKYAILTSQEKDSVKLESTHVIDVQQFTDANQLDPMFIDNTYYIVPTDKKAALSYVTMRDAMGTSKIAIGKLAMLGREYLTAIRAVGDALVMHTIHHAAELRTVEDIDLSDTEGVKVNPAELKMAKQLIDVYDADLNLSEFKDDYKASLRQMVDAKIAGRPIETPAGAPEVKAQQDLTSALAAALAAASGKKQMAKAKLSETPVQKITKKKVKKVA